MRGPKPIRSTENRRVFRIALMHRLAAKRKRDSRRRPCVFRVLSMTTICREVGMQPPISCLRPELWKYALDPFIESASHEKWRKRNRLPPGL